MSNNQFGSCLYRSQRDMLDAIAYEWLGGGGICSKDELAMLREISAPTMARQCIDGWKLNQPEDGWPGDDESLSHMDEQDYGAEDLADAFERLRELLMNSEEAA